MRNALLTTTVLTAFANSDAGTDINTPMGRIVWGHPLKPKHKTSNQNGTVVKLFKDDGSPRMEIAFGLAIPTAEFQASLWPAFFGEAAKMYTNGTPRDFSFKMVQEQELDKNNQPYGQREGYAGHVVISVSTELTPPSALVYENGAYRQIGEADIKTGDYVMVGLNLKVHGGQSPALYVNPRLIVKCYDGDAISSGAFEADPTQVFGAVPVIPAMPAGARPIGATAPGQMPPAGTMPAPATSQPMMGNAGTVAPGASGMPMQSGQAPGGMPGMQQPMGAPQGMNQMPLNGAPQGMPGQPGQMPPPATDFIPGAPAAGAVQGMPGQAAPGGYPMPGMPQR